MGTQIEGEGSRGAELDRVKGKFLVRAVEEDPVWWLITRVGASAFIFVAGRKQHCGASSVNHQVRETERDEGGSASEDGEYLEAGWGSLCLGPEVRHSCYVLTQENEVGVWLVYLLG